jgi:hypothetical protein
MSMVLTEWKKAFVIFRRGDQCVVGAMTLSITTLRITTVSMMTLSVTTVSIMTVKRMTIIITAFRITTRSITIEL